MNKYWERPEVSEEEGKKIIDRAIDRILMEKKVDQDITQLRKEIQILRGYIEQIGFHHREIADLMTKLGEVLFDD